MALGEDVYGWPQCGKETALATETRSAEHPEHPRQGEADRASLVGAQHAAPLLGAMSCAHCGAELTDRNLRKAERVTVPPIAGTRRVPNGQEVSATASAL